MALASLYELTSYALHLRCVPACGASLLFLETSWVPDLPGIHAKVLQAFKEEWEVVMEMEASASTSKLLHRLAPHVLWQVYRELACFLEQCSWQIVPEARNLIESWFPKLSFSANIEEQFNQMQDACKRGNKSQAAPMSNLSAVAVRSLSHGLLDGDGQAPSIKLADTDWEGSSIRGLKQKIFQPETFTGSFLASAASPLLLVSAVRTNLGIGF